MEPKDTVNHDDPSDRWNYRPWAQSSYGWFRVSSPADNAADDLPFGDVTDPYDHD